MKKKFKFLVTSGLLLILSGTLWAQDFTVIVPSTDNYQGYLKPVKASKSRSLQIKVTNNLSDVRTISVNKSMMGTVMSWVSVDNNSQAAAPGVDNPLELVPVKPERLCQ